MNLTFLHLFQLNAACWFRRCATLLWLKWTRKSRCLVLSTRCRRLTKHKCRTWTHRGQPLPPQGLAGRNIWAWAGPSSLTCQSSPGDLVNEYEGWRPGACWQDFTLETSERTFLMHSWRNQHLFLLQNCISRELFNSYF